MIGKRGGADSKVRDEKKSISGQFLKWLGLLALLLVILAYYESATSCKTAISNRYGNDVRIVTLEHSLRSMAIILGGIVFGVVIDKTITRVSRKKQSSDPNGLLIYLLSCVIAGGYIAFWLMAPIHLIVPCVIQALVGIMVGGAIGLGIGTVSLISMTGTEDFTFLIVFPALVIIGSHIPALYFIPGPVLAFCAPMVAIILGGIGYFVLIIITDFKKYTATKDIRQRR